MAQIAINIDKEGKGTIHTDRGAFIRCEKRDPLAGQCRGMLRFKLEDRSVNCGKCGQTYRIIESG